MIAFVVGKEFDLVDLRRGRKEQVEHRGRLREEECKYSRKPWHCLFWIHLQKDLTEKTRSDTK